MGATAVSIGTGAYRSAYEDGADHNMAVNHAEEGRLQDLGDSAGTDTAGRSMTHENQ